jgi:AcrR family transcriptional regulator
MSPRPYNLGKRQAQISQGRRQVLDAARGLLAEATSYADFTVDAVARRAGVARGTVYYQFGSKPGLLEAVCDDLAEVGGLADLADAFTQSDTRAAWRRFVAVFGGFWDADRPAMRRLRALAQLDPEVAGVIAARDERRRHGIEMLLRRLLDESVSAPARDTIARRLHALTSFETFDTLAGAERSPAEVIPEVVEMTEAVLRSAAITWQPST